MEKNKEIPVLLGVLGVVFAVLIFLFVYKPYIEKTETMETENQILMQALTKYQEIAENEVYYKETTENMNLETSKIISEYATGLSREDQIMYMANLENRFLGEIELNFFNMGTDQEISVGTVETEQEVPVETPSEDAMFAFQEPEVVDNGIQMFKNTIESGYKVSYEGLKDILDYVNGVGVKKNITGITLSFDSTSGLLLGSMSMNQYYLTGTDGFYSKTNIPVVKIGLENIFGTIDPTLNEEDPSLEE
jgi:hypothetical protein